MFLLRTRRPNGRRHPFFPCLGFLIPLCAGTATASAATVGGQVVDPDGRPAAAAHVLLTTPAGTRADRWTTRDGRFEITGVAPGEYDVRVALEGFGADPVHLSMTADEARDVTIQLRISAVAESIVVSAALVDLPLSRAPDAVTVITAADLQARQVEGVGDALRTVPGLTVLRSGGRGAITSLFARGGGSNYTLVRVDGMRVNSFGGGFDFGHLPVGDIERIEVIPAPESAIYGSDAISAVVDIVTRRGGQTRGDGVLEGGSQGTMRAVANGAGSRGAWTWGAGVERSQTDGFTGIAPATGERVSNDDDRLTRASGTLGWQRNGGADFLLAANIGRDERGFPGPFGSDPIGAFAGVDRVARGVNNTRQIGARFGNQWSTRIRQRVEANYTDISSDFTNAFGPSSSGTGRFDGRIQEDIALAKPVGLTAGVEVLHERGSSTFITGVAGTPIPIRRGVVGMFAEVRYLGSERFVATAGARVDHLTRDALEADPFAFSPRPAFPDQPITSFNPKVAVSYLLGGAQAGRAATRLHASAGTGIRPPDAFEIAFTDNPNLKPERSRNFDVGVDQTLAGGAVVVGVAAFRNGYDDLLVTVGRSIRDASHYRSDNISNARASGLELSVRARPARPLAVRASYTFMDTEILSVDGLDRVAPPPFTVGDALLRRPRHQGELDVTYSAGRVRAYGELTARGQVLDVEPNLGSFGGLFFAPGYGVVNAGATVTLSKQLAVYVRVLNLADREYEEILGYPALRRNGVGGVRLTF